MSFSVSQASQLVRTLERHGWTTLDFNTLLKGDMPNQVLEFIRGRPLFHIPVPDECPLEKLFSEELTRRLGFSQGLRSRVLNTLKDRGVHTQAWKMDSLSSITTLGQLRALTRKELAAEPNMAGRSLEYIDMVFGVVGIPMNTF